MKRAFLILGVLLLIIAGIMNSEINQRPACSSAMPAPSLYFGLHSKVVENGAHIDGSLLALDVNSSLPELGLAGNDVKLVKRSGVYIPKGKVTGKILIPELPANASFRVFYSDSMALHVPPVNFSGGRFVLKKEITINVSRGFSLNATSPRGSFSVLGEKGMDFLFTDSKASAGNRTFTGSPQKVLASFCTGCRGGVGFRVTGYLISLKLGRGAFDAHAVTVEWRPEKLVLRRGFSFSDLTLTINCTVEIPSAERESRDVPMLTGLLGLIFLAWGLWKI